MSRGEGRMGRRILDAVESDGAGTPLKDLAADAGELSSLKRAAKRLEAQGRIGIVYHTTGGRRVMCVTTPMMEIAYAGTGRTSIHSTREIRADELRRRIAALDAQRARLQDQLDQLTDAD